MSTTNLFDHELYESYKEGLECGMGALLARGGTRGAEWYADNRNLINEKREEFISGFNEALEEGESDEG